MKSIDQFIENNMITIYVQVTAKAITTSIYMPAQEG
jgi:hypothetical protein